ncbi:uncharacterized protein L201_005457 [Kwoniella dendrophila CBS 6074]|uniref:Uncharacterized protein n=1 Tax=Kwoniella dendrophila CBS 6074 TaxID=1295534 RepID=A0AAX4JYG0_9TREE
MSSFQVFLPPPTLRPFPITANDTTLELRFHNLRSSADEHSQLHSQSLSLRNRLGEKLTTWTEFSQGGLESLERSTVLGKRAERSDGKEVADDNSYAQHEEKRVNHFVHQKAIHAPNADKNLPEVIQLDNDISREHISGVVAKDLEQSRRGSRRVTRQSVSLLNTLPQIYPSAPDIGSGQSQGESFDSLSTTTSSFPSQLLSNPGNTSVYNLPRWSIPLHKLTSLSTLFSSSNINPGAKSIPTSTSIARTRSKQLLIPNNNIYHSIIICILSTESVIQRQRKEEKSNGREGTLFIGKWTVTAQPLPQQEELTCTVRLWDDCAQIWGEKVRRGDVVLLENVELKTATVKEPSQLSLSPNHSPKITILYRTLPRYESVSRTDYIYRPPKPIGGVEEGKVKDRGEIVLEDKILRPDLRLGRSEAGVRKVESIVKWFANWVGGEGPG